MDYFIGGEKMRPIIGITSGLKKDVRINSCLNYDYVAAINSAGGIAVILPVITDENQLDEYIKIIDGVVFSGGEDISPYYYGENPTKEIGKTCESRDSFEMGLIKRAISENKPVLGICRGMQLINVVLGGTLHQDINTQINNSLEHRSSEDQLGSPHHRVKILEDSLLYKLLNEREIGVNSFHHQSVKDIGTGLKPVAFSSDGVVEGIETTKSSFLLGVQWHPEKLVDNYPNLGNIFSAFIDACLGKKRI